MAVLVDSMSGEPRSAKGRYTQLWILLLVALIPLVAALVSYFGGLAQPEERLNKGELVLQQLPLTQWNLTTTSGEPWQLSPQWQLLLVVPTCQQQCQQWQYLLGQVKTSLGRDRHRVQPQLVLAPERVSMADQSGIEHAQSMPLPQLSLPRLSSPRANAIAPGVWLADPFGNLVLYYRMDQPPQDLVKDLKRLLKLSRVG